MNMKKTNRQTTKLLSLVMAILAVLCIISVPVKAQEYNHSFIITGPDTYRIAFGEDYRGKESVTTIRNQTTIPMRLDIQRSVARTKVVTPPKLKQFEWIEISVTNTSSGFVILEPGETISMTFIFRSDYSSGSSCMLTATRSNISDIGGKAFVQAQPIPVEGSISGALMDYGLNPDENARYFSLSLATKRYVNLELISNNKNQVTAWFYSKDNSTSHMAKLESDASADHFSGILDAGDYVLKLAYTRRQSTPARTEVFTLNISGREYIQATGVTLTCSSSNPSFDSRIKKKAKTFTITATTVPANSDDKMSCILADGNIPGSDYLISGNVEGQNQATFTITYGIASWAHYTYGYTRLSVKTEAGVLSNNVDIIGKAAAPVVSDVTSYYNKILFNKCQIGDSMYPSASQPVKVYMKSGKKWVLKATVKNGRPFQIKKLKPNTKYQFKFVSACKGPDGSLINGSSTVKTYRTGRKVKPAIRSISVSNVKVTYNSRFEKYMGKWTWRKYYTTRFTVNVQLKKQLPGTQGLYIDGVKCKGKGTNFKVNLSYSGNHRGRKTPINVIPYSNTSRDKGLGINAKTKVIIR